MTRDYWLDKTPGESNNSIKTSSFCVVHEITSPLYFDSTLKYNGSWAAEDFTTQELIDYIGTLPAKKGYRTRKY